MSADVRIAALGAGPAGLALAMKLRQRRDLDADVVVVERNPFVGGNASSFEHRGLHFDFGSHRLHPATAPEILRDIQALLGKELLDRPRRGRIRLVGRFVRFPLNPADLMLRLPLSFTAGVVRDMLSKPLNGRALQHNTFADVLRRGLGATICDNFYFPYARKLWGLSPESIAAIQAQRRVGARDFTKMLRKLVSVIPGLKPKGGGRFYYPRTGYGRISEALADAAERLGAHIRLETAVKEVWVRDGWAEKVVVETRQNGAARAEAPRRVTEEIPVDFVFSTIPITILLRSLRPAPPPPVMDAAQRLSFRGMILVYLILATDQFTPYDAHYFPDDGMIVSRLSEPKNYSASRDPAGLTGLCAEIPCGVGDSTWNASDAALAERVIDELERAELPVKAVVVEHLVRRIPQAYPIYHLDYEADFRAVDEYVATLRNVVTLGRQGLFLHDNTHHTVEMAYRANECLGTGARWDPVKWSRFREEFNQHTVED